jgi:hypothetical protein
MQVSIIYNIPSKVCVTQPVLVYHSMPQRLGVEKFHQALPIESSVRQVDLECRISSLAEGVRLSPLNGSNSSHVTIYFLCLLISREAMSARGAAWSLRECP